MMRDLQLKLLPRLALLVMASALWWASCALPQRLASALVSDDWHTETPSSSPSQCPSLVPHPSLVWWVWFLCAPLSVCVCVCRQFWTRNVTHSDRLFVHCFRGLSSQEQMPVRLSVQCVLHKRTPFFPGLSSQEKMPVLASM